MHSCLYKHSHLLGQPQYPKNFPDLNLTYIYNMLKMTRIYDRTNSETAIPWRYLEYNRVLKLHFIGFCFVSARKDLLFSITYLFIQYYLVNFCKICGIPEKQYC